MKKIERFGKNRNSNGFDKNPENINYKGRPVSIKGQLKNMLNSDGAITISKEQVKSINADGSVTINLPTQDHLAMKLLEWSISDKGNDSLRAIQIVMEQVDGKPNQKIEQTIKEKSIAIDPTKYTDEELDQLKRLYLKGIPNNADNLE